MTLTGTQAGASRRPVLREGPCETGARVSTIVVVPGAANAGGLVDPSNIHPLARQRVPSAANTAGRSCAETGYLDVGAVPVMDLPCGTVYESPPCRATSTRSTWTASWSGVT